ncbi:MAG: hypothetical protein GY851_17935 [bacterium]|nr:hypothetical protein [bacterium]
MTSGSSVQFRVSHFTCAVFTAILASVCWNAAGSDELYKLTPPEGGQFRAPKGLTVIRGRVYFAAAHDDKGPAIWATDGTPEGTERISPYATFSDEQRKSYEMLRKAMERSPSHNQELAQLLKDAHLNLDRPHSVRGVGDTGLFYFVSRTYETRSMWFMDERDGVPAEIRQFSAEFGKPELAWGLPVLDGRLLFLCRTPDHGCELWSSDGTPTGTSIVRDLVPGPEDAFVARDLKLPWALYRDRVFFSAPDGKGTPSLWSTDGTDAGTRFVVRLVDEGEKAVRPGERFIVHGDRLFFFRGGLWVSDGTADGTRRLRRDLSPGSVVSCEDHVYFVASAPGEDRKQLWRTDGTTEGTVKVTSPKPGQVLGQSGGSILYTEGLSVSATGGEGAATGPVQGLLPYDVPVWGVRLLNDRLFILADDYERPLEHSLYVSQTVGQGARCLKRNVMTQFFENLQEPIALDSRVFFILPDMAPGAIWVYRHDKDASPPEWPRTAHEEETGQEEATETPTAGENQAGPALFPVVKKEGYAVFDLYPGHVDSYPGAFTEARGRVFFRARTHDNRQALWVTDGTPEGTREAGRPNPYPQDDMRGRAQIQEVTALGDSVVFTANDGEHGAELWCSDGTPKGTAMVADLTAGSKGTFTRTSQGNPRYFARVANELYFWQAAGSDSFALWRTDGTTDGTKKVKTFPTGDPGRRPWLPCGDRLYFVTGPGNAISRLWVTDGTEAGTTVAAEGRGGIDLIAALNGRVYYTANFYTLFSTDGTADGVIDHNEEFNAGKAATVGDAILFFATRPDSEKEGGIYVLRDDPFSVEMVWPDGNRYQGPEAFVGAGSRVIFKFLYYDAYHVCDGTRTGSGPLWEGDLFPKAFLQGTRPAQVDDDVYFAINGELWRIPADEDKAVRCLRPQVRGLGPGSEAGVPDFVFNSIAATDDYLITSGTEPEYGQEVYVIDRK